MFGRTYRQTSPMYKQIGQEILQITDEAHYGRRQPEIQTAQNGENEVTAMQEMQCRKGNVRTHTLRVPGVRKVFFFI